MRQTREQLAERNAMLERENSLLSIALADVLEGTAQLVGQFTLEGTTIKARLCSPLRANGGVVLVTSTVRGQDGAMHTAYLLEEEYSAAQRRAGASAFCSEWYCLMGKVLTARNKVQDAHYASKQTA